MPLIGISQIPNAGFENWETNGDGVFEPVSWSTTNAEEYENVLQNNDAYEGNYSMELTVFEYMSVLVPGGVRLDESAVISQRYSAFNCYIKGSAAGNDVLNFQVVVFGDYPTSNYIIGVGEFSTDASYPDWTLIEIPITYDVDVPADSVQIYMVIPVDAGNNTSTSYLIDGLSFDSNPNPTNPVLVSASTNLDGTEINLLFDKSMADPTGNENSFSVTVNSVSNDVSSVALEPGNDKMFVLSMSNTISEGDVILVSYTPGTIESIDNMPLLAFTNFSVTNNVGSGEVSWHNITSPTNYNLLSVFFIDENNGWISGENHTFLRTTNGGQTWTSEDVPTSVNIFAVAATSANEVFTACYDTVYHSSDGGVNWEAEYLNTSNNDFYDIFFFDDNNGWIAGPATNTCKTTDGGNTWTNYFTGIAIEAFFGINFPTLNNGWAVGEIGIVANTTDGGENWTGVEDYFGTRANLYSVDFSNTNNGWIVGDSGLVYITTNAGTNWVRNETGSGYYYRDVDFIDNTNGWIVGNNGIIMFSENAGTSWNFQTSNTTNNLKSVCMINENLGWAVGENGTILKYGLSETFVNDNVNQNNIISIYPNPANSIADFSVNLDCSNNYIFEIFDINGKTVYSKNIKSQKFQINVSDFEDGIYLCKIKNIPLSNKKLVILH